MIRATSRHSRIASIGDLARVSLRMQVLFIVTLILAIIMLALCYWMISSLINVASTDARQHFQKLAYNLHGQESFLARAIKNEATRLSLTLAQGGPASFELIDSDASTYTYEGQSGSLAMPYIIKVSRNDSATGGDYSRRLQTVAAGLSNLYGSYRSPWQQPGMQVFLLDLNSPLSISVPCSEDSMTDDVHRWWRCPLSANRVRELIYTQTAKVSPSGLRWINVNLPGSGQDRIGYIIYSAIELPDALWAPETPKRNLVLATFSKCATYTTATPHTAGPISSTWAPRPASLPRPTAPRAWRAGRGGQQCALWAGRGADRHLVPGWLGGGLSGSL